MPQQRIQWFMRYLIVLTIFMMYAALNPAAAQVQVSVSLDRDRITENESVVLSIDITSNLHAPNLRESPDFRLLEKDFILGARSRSENVQISSGVVRRQIHYSISLQPRQSGLLTIPSLQIGNEKTIALPLTVEPAASASPGSPAPSFYPRPPTPDKDIFLKMEIDSLQPYVQQNVGIMVQLWHTMPIGRGEMVLLDPPHGVLQQVGEDQNSSQVVNGRRYKVLERHFILVPEQSGPLPLPGAYFKGISVASAGSPWLSVRSDNQVLQVQPLPSPLPQPWLPLHDLSLAYRQVPTSPVSGQQSITLEIEATAIGIHGPQLTDLPIPEVSNGTQIFADTVKVEEGFEGASPKVRLSRRYTLVPQQSGEIQVQGISMPWWNVATGEQVATTLPELRLEVHGIAQSPDSSASPVETEAQATQPLVTETPSNRGWMIGLLLLIVGSGLLWIWWRRRIAVASSASTTTKLPHQHHYTLPELRQALERNTPEHALAILVSMSGMPTLEAALTRLSSPKQRLAIERLQRARWSGEGSVATAYTNFRQVFRDGPQWRPPSSPTTTEELPPLYPSQAPTRS